jgi:hypothetical protein
MHPVLFQSQRAWYNEPLIWRGLKLGLGASGEGSEAVPQALARCYESPVIKISGYDTAYVLLLSLMKATVRAGGVAQVVGASA